MTRTIYQFHTHVETSPSRNASTIRHDALTRPSAQYDYTEADKRQVHKPYPHQQILPPDCAFPRKQELDRYGLLLSATTGPSAAVIRVAMATAAAIRVAMATAAADTSSVKASGPAPTRPRDWIWTSGSWQKRHTCVQRPRRATRLLSGKKFKLYPSLDYTILSQKTVVIR
jgi:hypothetical protein